MEATRDRIVGLHGSWFSGLATLILEGGQVFCENGATVRALEACFGGVIGEGHTIDNEGIQGADIVYSTDFMGILEGFTPYQDWLDKGLPELELGETKEIEDES